MIQQSMPTTDRAVSPVIGVILMVAITVILAAVIAVFVLDLGGSIQSEASAGVNINGDGSDNVTVTLTSLGSNTDGVYIEGASDNASATESGAVLDSVGQSLTISTVDENADIYVDSEDTGSYSVVAYMGSSAENPDRATTVSTFTVGS